MIAGRPEAAVGAAGTGDAPDLVTFGETMALLSPPGIGLLRHATTLELSVGGTESNVAIGVQRLGGRATWIGRVGDDELGKRVLREIQAEGVDTRAIVDPDAPTGLMLKARRSQIRTQLWYYRSGSAGSKLQASDIDDELITRTRILHLTGITPGLSDSARGAAEHACRVAREAGTQVSLDLNFRQALWKPTDFSATIRELLPFADIVFGSAHECAYIVGDEPDSPAAQARALAQLGPRQCVIKLGEHGAVALVDGTVYRRGSYDVPVVDTVGAGDAFVAGWLAEYLRNPSDVTAMLETAVACGAYACTVRGDWEGAPGRDELDQLIQTGETVSR
jgi:2-dehydro-3-deoxygluconokinase